MTKHLLSLLIITFIFFGVRGQDFPAYLKENAVKIDNSDSLNKQVYDVLSGYRLIMIGEMHGTNEPVKFATNLAELFASKGDSVQFGFEIPSDQMKTFLILQTDSSVFRSEFFVNPSFDGKASVAWAKAIILLSKNPRIKVFFYDLNKDETSDNEKRDSLMYGKIRSKIKEHLSWKTITIGGNVHNMLLPYKGKNKIAYYLCKDTTLNIASKLCTLNHYYQCGTMLNNRGNGLELQQVQTNSSLFSGVVGIDNYLLLFPNSMRNEYTGIFFTRTVTAAEMVKKK